MVEKAAMSPEILPGPGDEVEVAWGLDTVRGRVVESYRGVRPRVVVEIAPGEVDSEPTTVTVPPSALEPAETSQSRWARAARYEKSLRDSLSRALHGRLEAIESDPSIEGRQADLLVRLADGTAVVIEVKHSRQGSGTRSLRTAQAYLEAMLRSRPTWHGLVVTDREIPNDLDASPRTASVEWSGHEDDSRLTDVLSQLLARH